MGYWGARGRHFSVHDPENFTRTGDKVVITRIPKIAPTKSYMVRNIVLPIGRMNVSGFPETQYEKDALTYNKNLRNRTLSNFY